MGWGRMFVRMCPYFRFPHGSVSISLTGWRFGCGKKGIDFQQSTNAFLQCGNPARLQELADSLTTRDLLQCGQKWLAAFTPFITDNERRHAGCQHRLFFAASLRGSLSTHPEQRHQGTAHAEISAASRQHRRSLHHPA
jgi:hypothetical protein